MTSNKPTKALKTWSGQISQDLLWKSPTANGKLKGIISRDWGGLQMVSLFRCLKFSGLGLFFLF
jgi:hypothetical protein